MVSPFTMALGSPLPSEISDILQWGDIVNRSVKFNVRLIGGGGLPTPIITLRKAWAPGLSALLLAPSVAASKLRTPNLMRQEGRTASLICRG